MTIHFKNLDIHLLQYVESDFMGLPVRGEDMALIIETGLPKNCPPNGLRFKIPASMSGTGFSRLSDEWPKFKEVVAAQQCIVIATDSNGNCLFINATDAGKHQVSFYDHDYGVFRFVAGSVHSCLTCLSLYLEFLKLYPENGTEPATKDDYQLLANQISEVEPLARVNAETFWSEMVFYGRLP